MPCGLRDLRSPIGDKPVPPALEAQSPNHWTAGEVPEFTLLKYTIQWFLVYSRNCAPAPLSNSSTFSSPSKETPDPSAVTPQPLAATNLLLSVDLPVLGVSLLGDTF